MWLLLLNDMRSGNIENLEPVKRAETKEALKAFVEGELTEPYKTDGTRILHHTTDQIAGTTEIDHGYTWQKCFKFGGPLEWYNKPYEFDEYRHYIDVGTSEDWENNARIKYENKVLSIPSL